MQPSARSATARSKALARGEHAFDIKVGANTGLAVVGNVGSDKRFNYTAVGEAVNIAARLEGLPGVYRNRVIIGPETATRIGDPDAVITCQRAGVRGTVTLSLGGTYDPNITTPVLITGEVVAISEGGCIFEGPMTAGLRSTKGNAVVLRVGGIDVIISSARLHTLDCGIFRSQSIDPESKSVLGIKSTHQFRATFEPIAREVLLVDAGGLTSRNLANLPYRNVRRPVWSLDED